jgi:hypothetical protein
MTQTHTPGPWEIADDLKTMDCIGIYGANNQLVAEIRDPESVKPQEREAEEALFRANARLIAAAPELLEELKTLVQLVAAHIPDEADNWNRAALAAITKAEGRA